MSKITSIVDDIIVKVNDTVKLTGNQTIAGVKTFSGLSKTSTGDNALEVITSSSNASAGSFMVSQGAKYGLALNGIGTALETGSFAFQVIDRDLKTVKSMPFSIGINGVVSYTSSPVVPTPTTGTQVANKSYVDSASGGAWSANDARAKTALNASGEAPIYACRAWVNFNGIGTVAIRASGNVSSITDNGTGDYTVNFTTAMVDTNYSVSTNASYGSSNSTYIEYVTLENYKLSSSLRLGGANLYNSSGFYDSAIVSVAVFR